MNTLFNRLGDDIAQRWRPCGHRVHAFPAIARAARQVDAALDAMPYPRDLSVQPLERALAQLRGELDRDGAATDGI